MTSYQPLPISDRVVTSLSFASSPLLWCQQHLFLLYVTMPLYLCWPGSTLRVWHHFLCGRVPVCCRLRHEWGNVCAIRTVWLHLPQQILPCKRPYGRVTALTVFHCVMMWSHFILPLTSLPPSCSWTRSLWLMTVLRPVNAPAPALCAKPKPVRMVMSAPSTNSNVTATEVCVCFYRKSSPIWKLIHHLLSIISV